MKALLILTLASQSPNCPDDPSRLAASAAIVCAHEQALLLEPSGEPASDVAEVVVSLCQADLNNAIAMLNRCLPVRFKARDMDEMTRRRAFREVIEIRAKRRG